MHILLVTLVKTQEKNTISELLQKYTFNKNNFLKILYLLGYFQLQVTENLNNI